ncbi:MAG: serine/threonine-protein kinase [Candidatus Sumerlaeota bacterium]|nr:serine/threonine-protein kinase [Candidatus Sumerlaeota bacterium]
MANGRLKLIEKLGQGGMGVVWKARDKDLNRLVAIKRPFGYLERFQREAQAAANLQHPNVITIHSVSMDEGVPFIEMQFVDGHSLYREVKELGHGMDLKQVCEIGSQLCNALEAAHQIGIIHRDIKPGNIMIAKGDGRPLIGDFGLAAAHLAEDEIGVEQFSLTMTHAAMGTMHYAPPEQMRDAKSADARSDIYSLAATIYFMLTGEEPKKIRIDRLPAAIRPILDKALEDDPDLRQSSAAEFGQELLQCAQQSSVESHDVACPKCHKESPLTAGHCVHCGASLESLFKSCAKCGVKNRVDQKFCQKCGSNLAAQAEIARLRIDIGPAEANHQYIELRQMAERGVELEPNAADFRQALERAQKILQQIESFRKQLDQTPESQPNARLAILKQWLVLLPGTPELLTAIAEAEREKAQQTKKAKLEFVQRRKEYKSAQNIWQTIQNCLKAAKPQSAGFIARLLGKGNLSADEQLQYAHLRKEEAQALITFKKAKFCLDEALQHLSIAESYTEDLGDTIKLEFP